MELEKSADVVKGIDNLQIDQFKALMDSNLKVANTIQYLNNAIESTKKGPET
eukprot:TRINITY_DN1457_c0_g1_i2.p2 TRINITY_DN1457_c0_g1~~TRINITY_DN1457_c0_g1_i2.p2  ORF type:complete len:52 (+),score=8.40 TRINITY_DN1457_c0_g1_i2:950-1105(+)